MADTTRTTGFPPGTARSQSGGSGGSAGASHPGQNAGPHGQDNDGALHAMSEGAGQAIGEAKKVGTELVGAVRDSAVSLLDAQRNRAAEQVASIGEALRRSGESFDGIGADTVVRYTDMAAEQITGLANTLRDRSWSELADDIERFARQWPIAFTASAIGIGFLAGRFMLSSAEQARRQEYGAAARSALGAEHSHLGSMQRDSQGPPSAGTHIGGSHTGGTHTTSSQTGGMHSGGRSSQGAPPGSALPSSSKPGIGPRKTGE